MNTLGLPESIWQDLRYGLRTLRKKPVFVVTAILTLALAIGGNPAMFTIIRAEVQALDPDQSIANIQTMDSLVDAQVGQRRLFMLLLESFAGVALLLALIGIYGVIAYSVSQRTQEVGIRRALGANESDILWLVIRQALILMLAGIALGLAGAFALTRVATAALFEVSPTHPASFAATAMLFLLVALAAGYIPARRAARIEAALRIGKARHALQAVPGVYRPPQPRMQQVVAASIIHFGALSVFHLSARAVPDTRRAAAGSKARSTPGPAAYRPPPGPFSLFAAQGLAPIVHLPASAGRLGQELSTWL